MSNSICGEIKKYNETINQPIVIFGTSGISKEVYTVINEINSFFNRNVFDFMGYVAEDSTSADINLPGGKVVCIDDDFQTYSQKYERIAAVIPLGSPVIKKRIRKRFENCTNVYYPNIISPSAKIMLQDRVWLGEGNIICSGVVATTDIRIGNFNLFNLNTTIGHDVNIGDFNVINPLSAISGCVTVEDNILIGAGVSIKEHTIINSNSTLGMGAIVCKNVDTETIVVSDRAKPLVK